MELDTRKMQILKAIIDEYVISATPVGSRSISRLEGFHISSATIRNEMSDLEEMGYLEQPHTSAGRIPSDKAYRLYVNSIMNRASLTKEEITSIRSHFITRIDEIESVMKQTAQALSAATNYTSMVLPPMLAANRLKHLQMVPLGDGRALLVVVTDAGFARDAVIRIPDDMRADELEQLSRKLTGQYKGCRMDIVGDRIVSEMSAEMQDRRLFLNSIVETIERRISPTANSVELSGATNILHYPEYADMNKAKTFLAAVEGKEALYSMLKKASTLEFTITIGSENEHEQLKDCSILTATYRAGDTPLGSFGIIGPTRMHYSKVFSVMEYMRLCLGELLTNYIEEEKR